MKKILLVDDEPAIRFAFDRMLNSSQITVDTAMNVIEAKRLLLVNRYSAVITDLRLTGTTTMDGFEIIKESKALQPDCKVIVITAYGGEEIKNTVLAMGADSYLEKPVLVKTVTDLLKSMQIG